MREVGSVLLVCAVCSFCMAMDKDINTVMVVVVGIVMVRVTQTPRQKLS